MEEAMTTTPATSHDAEALRQSYLALRELLVRDCERRHAEVEQPDRRRWLARHAKKADDRLLAALGVSHEEIRRLLAEDARVRQDYYAAEIEPSLTGQTLDHPLPEPSHPALFDAQMHQPVPYAQLCVANDTALLDDAPPEAALHNPFYDVTNNYLPKLPFVMKYYGKGDGLYDSTFYPEYDTFKWKHLFWIYKYTPAPGAALTNWFASAKMHLHGAASCWCDDSWWSSTYAEVRARMALRLVPVSLPYLQGVVEDYWLFPDIESCESTATFQTFLHYHGTNIDHLRWGGWVRTAGPLVPWPWRREEAHWVVLEFEGLCHWRGESTTILNFGDGSSNSGSKETGSYQVHPYCITPMHVSVYQPGLVQPAGW